MSAWLGVVSAEHVRRGVSLGIAQIGVYPGQTGAFAEDMAVLRAAMLPADAG